MRGPCECLKGSKRCPRFKQAVTCFCPIRIVLAFHNMHSSCQSWGTRKKLIELGNSFAVAIIDNKWWGLWDSWSNHISSSFKNHFGHHHHHLPLVSTRKSESAKTHPIKTGTTRTSKGEIRLTTILHLAWLAAALADLLAGVCDWVCTVVFREPALAFVVIAYLVIGWLK